MTANTSSGYVASSNLSSSTPYYAFDNNTGTSFDSSNYDSSGVYAGSTTTSDVSGNSYSGDWLQISFPVSVKVTYALNRFGNFSGGQAAQLLGSNDGSSWTKIGLIPGFSWNAGGSAGGELYISTNTLYFSTYRLVWTAGLSGLTTLTVRSTQLTGYPLTNLQVSGDITSSGVIYAPNGVVGTLKTASQPYVQSLGTLSSLSTSGLTCLGASTLQATQVLSLSSSGQVKCSQLYCDGNNSGMYFTTQSGISSSTVLRQGGHYGWNLSGNQGESIWINKSGGGNGGSHHFY